MTLTEQKKQALDLYINQSYTQQQVADAVGVCVRTIHNWVKQHAWDRLRLATHQAQLGVDSCLRHSGIRSPDRRTYFLAPLPTDLPLFSKMK